MLTIKTQNSFSSLLKLETCKVIKNFIEIYKIYDVHIPLTKQKLIIWIWVGL